jgi:hypothetical protein
MVNYYLKMVNYSMYYYFRVMHYPFSTFIHLLLSNDLKQVYLGIFVE